MHVGWYKCIFSFFSHPLLVSVVFIDVIPKDYQIQALPKEKLQHLIEKSSLSDHQLTVSEHQVLQKGLNFAPTPRQLPVKRINTFIEKALKEVSKELANTACKTYFQTPCRVYHPPANLLASKRSSISSLRSDKTTTILPADREVSGYDKHLSLYREDQYSVW